MLLRLLKSVLRRRGAPAVEQAGSGDFRAMERLARRHEAAPMRSHLEILFDGVTVRGIALEALVEAAVRDSAIGVPPLKLIHRRTAWLYLLQYFVRALDVPGWQAECGVFRGTTALLLCR